MDMMPLDLFIANKEFIKNHREPKVLTLDEDTKVVNKRNTSNRHPNGNFGNSWMNYWIAFSGIISDFTCSIDGLPIWIEDDQESCETCKKENRFWELFYGSDTENAQKAYNGREAHGAHVRYEGKTYIVPMSASENTSLGDKEVEITLKAGTVLVEEVSPRIEE